MRNLLLSMLLTAAFIVAAYADSIDLEFYNDVIYKGEIANGSVVVKVNRTGTYVIDIYALGYEAWITKDFGEEYLLSNTSYTYTISFFPPKYAKSGAYAIYVYLKDDNGNVLADDKHIIHLVDSPDLQITDVKLENPELAYLEPLKIYVLLKNYGKIDAENYQLLIKIEQLGIIKKVILPVVEKEKETTYYWEIDLGEVLPGNYKGVVELYDAKGKQVDKRYLEFRVKEQPEIKEDIKESFNLFRKSEVITLRNEGNAAGNYTFRLKTYLPFLYEIKQQKECNCSKEYSGDEYIIRCVVESKKVCSFLIIKNYWMYYLALVLAIMVLIISFIIYTTPSINKYYYRKGHKYKVILKIHNPHPKHALREVVVKDKVNGILTIREETIIPKPSRIKKMKDYALIEWHINELKPGEERIITYEVIPKIDVEDDIVMHEAEMEGKIKRKKKRVKAKSERK